MTCVSTLEEDGPDNRAFSSLFALINSPKSMGPRFVRGGACNRWCDPQSVQSWSAEGAIPWGVSGTANMQGRDTAVAGRIWS
jgi:hypothetical protein